MATELAKAYVQIIPSAQGIQKKLQSAMSPELSAAGENAGQTLGASLVGKLKGVIAAAGIGKFLASSFTQGGELEQSIGGIETLFKDSYSKVEKYANQAYKTAGLSANDYMQQVTSFSASLLQSLDGDTNKAAESANQALTDMSDNANKMGTDMQLIQNAYQGFAKQNYTMLDNLKLGYGGTKEEMQRLLADATKLTGVKYDINNLNDVYGAIHAIQGELGITGTTAKEAASTFSGSFASMKGAAENFLATLALGENSTMTIQKAMGDLLSSAATFLFKNALPMFGNIVKAIPSLLMQNVPLLMESGMNMLVSLSEGFVQGFPIMAEKALSMVQNFATRLSEQVPVLISKGFEMLSNLVSGIVNALPMLIQKVPVIVSTFANIINDNFPTILKKGFDLLVQLIKGIISAIPTLIQNIPQIIRAIVDTIMAFQWLKLGKSIISFFGNGIKNMAGFVKESGKKIFDSVHGAIKNLPSTLKNLAKSAIHSLGNTISGMVSYIKTAALKIVSGIETTLLRLPKKVVSIGKDLIKGLWNGISDMTGWIVDKIGGFADSVVDSICDFFGINSPSKVMRDEVGIFLAQGVGAGFSDGMRKVQQQMEESIPSSFSIAPVVEYNAALGGIGRMTIPGQQDIDTLPTITIEVPVELDGETIATVIAPSINEKIKVLQQREMRKRGVR